MSETYTVYKSVDVTFGMLYILSFVVGLPGNYLAFQYFRRKQRDLATSLYIIMTINDSLICAFCMIDMPIFFNNRKPTLFFGNVCIVWINLYQLFIRMSIATTATISVTRTISLVYPLSHINKKKVILCLLGYGLFIISMTAIPSMAGLQESYFDEAGAYCWLMPRANTTFASTWDHVDNTFDCIALAVPVLPITVSCVISTYCVLKTPKDIVKFKYNPHSTNPHKSCPRTRTKSHATVTIIIFTVVYLIFNVPLFVMYVFWYLTIHLYEYPEPFFATSIMYNYSWNFVEILSVAMNAAINPCLYFIRLKKFRVFIKTRQSPRSNAFDISTAGNALKNSCANIHDDVIIQNSVLVNSAM